MKTITDKDVLIKLIDSIKNRGAKLDSDVQLAGLSSLAHLKAHGDIGFVNRLYLAMGKGARKAALTSWFLTYGSLSANTDGATKADKPFVFSKDKETNVEGASQDPWFDHKPDAAPDTVFDVQKALEAIIKKAKGKELVHGGLLTGVQGLLAMMAEPKSDAIDAADEAGVEGAPTEATVEG